MNDRIELSLSLRNETLFLYMEIVREPYPGPLS